MIAERSLQKKNKKSPKPLIVVKKCLGHIYTLIAVMLLWVLFRNDIGMTIKLILKMFGINYSRFTEFQPFYYDELISPKIGMSFYLFAFIGILFSFPWWRKFSFIMKNSFIEKTVTIIKYIAIIVLFVLCYANLAGNSYNPFIYFRF